MGRHRAQILIMCERIDSNMNTQLYSHIYTAGLKTSLPISSLLEAVLLLFQEALDSSLNGVPLDLLVCRPLPRGLQVKLLVVVDHGIGFFPQLLLFPPLKYEMLTRSRESWLTTLYEEGTG